MMNNRRFIPQFDSIALVVATVWVVTLIVLAVFFPHLLTSCPEAC